MSFILDDMGVGGAESGDDPIHVVVQDAFDSSDNIRLLILNPKELPNRPGELPWLYEPSLRKYAIIMPSDSTFRVGMLGYASAIEMPVNQLAFYYKGRLMDSDETPVQLQIQNDDEVEVKWNKDSEG